MSPQMAATRASRLRRGFLACGCSMPIILPRSKGPVQHGRPLDQGDREKQQDEHAERERHGDRALAAAALLRLGEDDSIWFALVAIAVSCAPYPSPGKNARTTTST